MLRVCRNDLALCRYFKTLKFSSFWKGTRIGLIGPNGAGKSTLLAVLAGEVDSDSGDVATRKRARIAYVLQQESTFAPGT